MISSAFVPIGLGLFGLFTAVLVFLKIKSSPAGEGKLKEVSELIEADRSLGEQITVFENEFAKNDDVNKK